MQSQSKIYYSIGEVAKTFNVSTSLIRFWEREFDVLRPKKNKKGNRLFTEKDVRYLHMIYNMVKVKGYTLQGAREALKNNFEVLEDQVNLLDTLHQSHQFLKELDNALAQRAEESV